jgi:hypothetical protein
VLGRTLRETSAVVQFDEYAGCKCSIFLTVLRSTSSVRGGARDKSSADYCEKCRHTVYDPLPEADVTTKRNVPRSGRSK